MNKEVKNFSQDDIKMEISKETSLKTQEQGIAILEDALQLSVSANSGGPFAPITTFPHSSVSAWPASQVGIESYLRGQQRSGSSGNSSSASSGGGVGRYNYILFALSTYSLMSAASEIFGVGIITTAAQCDLDLDMYKRGLIGSLPMRDVERSPMGLRGGHQGAASGTNAVMYTLLGESTPQSHRARFLLYAATGVSFSQSLMAIVAMPILKGTFSFPTFLGFAYRPWRLLAQTYGLMNGLNLILLFTFVHESPKFYLSRGQENEGLDILTKIFVRNTGKDVDCYTIKHVVLDEEVASKREQNFFKSIWAQTAPLLSKQHIRNTMLMFYTCIVVYSVGPSFVMWFPEILNSFSNNMDRVNDLTFCEIIQKRNETAPYRTTELITGCDDRVNDLTLGLIIACGSYLLILTGSLVLIVKFIGKKWTLIGVHVTCALAAFALNNLTNVSSIILFIIMISNASCMGITTTYAVELFPTYMRAMAVCLTMMVGRTFSFIVINAIAPLVKSNCVLLFYGLGIFLLSGGVSGWFLPADNKEIRKEGTKKF
ncbi:hypothetical protein EVAR_24529_1 [Eumeta japonica]|uniref:Synaptic vesicle glycoprotein 2B n=1 Tax=Eumeta variegata TaxID=151549 RepID=A0A4C1UQV2_EUMVA|nr:hypothetical protein EVAR_24529_1 [Eumeta japonica]